MAVNKVVQSNGTTLIDITPTTAVASDVTSGKIFFLSDGTQTTGTGPGGGSSVQVETGTISGSGNNILQIPCDFAPDLIYVYGDMSGSASLRGCVSFTIIKDTYLEATVDGSSSNTDEFIYWNDHSITGYSGGDVSMPHGEYTNGTIILDMVDNTSATRFNSGVTYSYKFVKWT